mgnify:CR=1 FL=1
MRRLKLAVFTIALFAALPAYAQLERFNPPGLGIPGIVIPPVIDPREQDGRQGLDSTTTKPADVESTCEKLNRDGDVCTVYWDDEDQKDHSNWDWCERFGAPNNCPSMTVCYFDSNGPKLKYTSIRQFPCTYTM